MNDNSNANLNARQHRGAKRRAKTRADLLAAARHVFARKGYHDASILDITEAADVGVGTFYLHFRDKDEIFNTLIDEVLRILEEQVINEVLSSEAVTLPVIVRSIFHHAYAERDLFSIALASGAQVAQTIRVEDMIAQGLTRAFERATQSGQLQGYDIFLLARLVTGVIAQGIIWWFEQDDPGPEEMAQNVLNLLEHGLPASLFEENLLPPGTEL
ncbi:TetR/AcrR family transcriptional regulator [Dictyobacter kobayashii]|uniref:TetR family transcriptional regulator n=1 Tax=Dictyobacter kobayashii TaxID=2014872 RepID=A0A402ALR3_9CHLR|nr:TetR/AcrR family transcriptional regulator [Dictyobacter kobayashii]GCE20056.1 TetR family transcriptional regulator [Dictyobacter kobayashii]